MKNTKATNRKSPTCEIVSVNKKLIDDLLSLNTHNRNLKESHVEYLRQEIREKRWCFTNQGIGITEDNIIVDGQHRLYAIALEGYPEHLQLLIVRNLPSESIRYVDQGFAKRSMSDTLSLVFNETVGPRLVATCNVLLKRDHDWLRPSNVVKFSPTEILKKLQQIEEEAKVVLGVRHANRLSAPVIAAIIAFLEENPNLKDEVIEFVEKLITGAMLEQDNPIHVLRSWLIRTSKVSSVMSVLKERFMKTTSALEAHTEKRSITRLYGKGLRGLAASKEK